MSELSQATFGGGCFWCTEAVFQQMNGVESVVSGYAGGEAGAPTYEQVCSGITGYAEVIQVTFDSAIVSFDELLDVFFHSHDPTTLNRQGADRGTQYRSIILHLNDDQREAAERAKRCLDDSGEFPDPIVTTIESLTEFYPAERHHQNYYQDNAGQPYCMAVIRPKMEKAQKEFSSKLKPNK
jgi:peptide-methionine (S)-S-oxide reductase